jgi:hypothetical protein
VRNITGNCPLNKHLQHVGLIDDLIRIACGEVSVELLSIVNKKSSCGYATHFFILNSKSMNSSVHGSVLNIIVSSLSYIHRYRRKMFFLCDR